MFLSVPPKFSKSGINEKIQVMLGSAIFIECPVKSMDEFKIQWKKNGNILPEFENRTMNIPFSTVSDEGQYICVGSNIAGWLAYKFNVIVLGI